MKKEGIDIGPLFVMIIGFLLGMVIISLTSCDGQKPKTVKEIKEWISKTNWRIQVEWLGL